MSGERFTLIKPLFALAFLLGLWWVVPMGLKSIGRVAFYEFQAPAHYTGSALGDLQRYWAFRAHSKKDLIEAGRDLARVNAHYELRRIEVEALRTEIARLEHLLDLPSLPAYRYEPARVIKRDVNGWWSQIVIRKGAESGIPVGAGVVYSGGVIGRVKEVHAYTSVVELLSSRTFRMAAHFDEDDRPVTYQGAPNVSFTRPRGRVNNVQADVAVAAREPRRLVSSRLGGVFPDGLTIGFCKELVPSSDGLFQSGEILLDAQLLSVMEVSVLIPVEASERD